MINCTFILASSHEKLPNKLLFICLYLINSSSPCVLPYEDRQTCGQVYYSDAAVSLLPLSNGKKKTDISLVLSPQIFPLLETNTDP